MCVQWKPAVIKLSGKDLWRVSRAVVGQSVDAPWLCCSRHCLWMNVTAVRRVCAVCVVQCVVWSVCRSVQAASAHHTAQPLVTGQQYRPGPPARHWSVLDSVRSLQHCSVAPLHRTAVLHPVPTNAHNIFRENWFSVVFVCPSVCLSGQTLRQTCRTGGAGQGCGWKALPASYPAPRPGPAGAAGWRGGGHWPGWPTSLTNSDQQRSGQTGGGQPVPATPSSHTALPAGPHTAPYHHNTHLTYTSIFYSHCVLPFPVGRFVFILEFIFLILHWTPF